MPASLRQVLLLAYHFPPDPSIGGARPFRFYTHLPDAGWSAHVITAAAQLTPDSRITSIPDPFLTKSPFRLSWQCERLLRKFWIPGHTGTVWAQQAAQAAYRWNAQPGNKNTVLFTTAPPLGVLFAGLLIKRRTGIPWVADFRDPLVDLDAPRTLAVLRWAERSTLQNADLVIVNTSAVAEQWQSRYPQWAHKIRVLWNGYDAEDGVFSTPWNPGPCRQMCHVGALYAGRTPDVLVRSVERLLASGRLAEGSVNIKLVGPTDPHPFKDPALLERSRAAGWVDFTGKSVPQHQARLLCQESDVLLLLQPQSNYQVPGKLFEYIRYQRPILAVVPPQSSVEKLLALSGVSYRCIYPEQSAEEIDAAVMEVLTLSPASITGVSDRFAGDFSAGSQARQLAQYLDQLLPSE